MKDDFFFFKITDSQHPLNRINAVPLTLCLRTNKSVSSLTFTFSEMKYPLLQIHHQWNTSSSPAFSAPVRNSVATHFTFALSVPTGASEQTISLSFFQH
jgi:hypothetical protein